MLIKAKRIDGVTIYRRGCGYLFHLKTLILNAKNAVLTKDCYYFMCREFLDVKNVWLFYRLHKKAMGKILSEVLAFNIPKSESQTPAKQVDDEFSLVEIVDILAANYGWTPDYILENIDMFDLEAYIKTIGNRENRENKLRCYMQMNPKAVVENIARAQGKEQKTMTEIASGITPQRRAEIEARIKARDKTNGK